MLSAIKFAPPGSVSLLAALTIVGLALLWFWRARRRLVGWALLALYSVYLILALPDVAMSLADSLPAPVSAAVASTQPLRTVLVFDGDNRRGRVREALQLARSHPDARVLVLGGEDRWVADALAAGGLPSGQIARETTLKTTREQIARATRLAALGDQVPMAIVASRLQMARVAALARTAGLNDALLVASPIDDEPARGGGWRFVPSYVALRLSRDAIYEHAALAYYHWRGWI